MKRLGTVFGMLGMLWLGAGCGSGAGGGGTAGAGLSNAADETFLQDMIAHHEQAIAAGQLAAEHGMDPRVVAFGRRIVREQMPELLRMRAMVSALKITVSAAAGAQMAVNRITPAQLTSLAATSGVAFDRTVIADSAMSEQGAVQMAKREVADGTYAPALALARPIASAANPGSEIAQLQHLQAAL